MSDKKFRLDVLKVLLDGIKTKLLLFASALGGSLAILIKNNNLVIMGVFSLLSVIMFIGVILNLVKFNKHIKEIEGMKNDR